DVRSAEELVALRYAVGEVPKARALAQEWLARFPLSYFLREEIGDPDLRRLANDANRVLNIAAQYMRLGLYQRALGVLSREYPAATPDEVSQALSPRRITRWSPTSVVIAERNWGSRVPSITALHRDFRLPMFSQTAPRKSPC